MTDFLPKKSLSLINQMCNWHCFTEKPEEV